MACKSSYSSAALPASHCTLLVNRIERTPILRQSSANIALTIAILTVVSIGSFALLVSVALPEGNETYAAIQNFGHFLLFATLGVIVLPIVNAALRDRFIMAVIVAGAGLCLLGGGVELFQMGQAGRNASTTDFALDVAGIAVGFLIVTLYRLLRHRKKSLGVLAVVGIIAVTGFAVSPLVPLIGFDLLRPDYPAIRSFDHVFATQKIESVGGASYEKVRHNPQTACCVLRVTFTPAQYSGVIFQEHAPSRYGRWSDFTTLNIKVFSSLRNTRQIALRINDGLHNNLYEDRYNGPHLISPGLNELSVPLSLIARMGVEIPTGREMDINDVTRIQIFVSDVKTPFTLDIVSIGLE